MTYEVLVIIVAINAIVTLSLWRKVASQSQLKQESSHRALAEEGVAHYGAETQIVSTIPT